MDIKKTILPSDKLKPLFADPLSLKFGMNFTDHMFTMIWDMKQGWHSAEIKPYQPLVLDPASSVFHYGQEIFEGQKAYKSKKNEILLFRPYENARRFNSSMKRMAMPEIPVEDFIRIEEELLKIEERWIPSQKGASLYIRPTGIGTEPALGVRPSNQYMFFIILSPVGLYFPQGFNPVSLYVGKEYARAGEGGTGAAKCGGNYGGSLAGSREAAEKGFNQVLWLDSKEHRYIEEVGAMNIFFVIDNQLVTPPLTGTILPGITRKSILEMAADLGITPVEKRLTIEEVIEGIKCGKVTEAFGAGTAAIVSPVGKLHFEGQDYVINNNQPGPWAKKLFDTFMDIQYGDVEDKYNWVHVVK